MSFSEHTFNHPHELYAPVDKMGASLTGLPGPGDPQQSSLSENSLNIPQYPLENPTADLTFTEEHPQIDQNDSNSLGLLAQGTGDLVKQFERTQGGVSLEEEQPSSVSFNNPKLMRARRVIWQETDSIPRLAGGQDKKKQKKDAPLNPLTEDRGLLPKVDSKVSGKIGVDLHRDLSPHGQKLLDCLIEERGDIDLLPTYAAEDQFDLNGALDELRRHGLLDESDPKRVKLVSRRLK